MVSYRTKSPMDSKEIKPANPKGNQPWIFTGRTDAEDEAPILWPPEAKNRLIGKDPDAGKDWKQEGEGGDRGRDGWMPSLTQRSWVWTNSGVQWRIGKPGILQFMGWQRVRHETEGMNITTTMYKFCDINNQKAVGWRWTGAEFFLNVVGVKLA